MVLETIVNFAQGIVNGIPEPYRSLFVILMYTLFIVFYAVFIWKFYKFLSSKDILQLNLDQYNHSGHPILEKILAVVLYTIEYMVILPFLVLFWFAILSMFLLVLSSAEDVQQILMIAAAIIAAIRITAYIAEDLSKDVAKILPFTVLAMFILDADLFNSEQILNRILQIPSLFTHILMFVVFIFVVEFILRMVYLIAQFFSSEEERVEEG